MGKSWWYINQKPPNLDIKIHMKTPFRTPPGFGMGVMGLWTKTLSPHHYGETILDATRTMLLLRSWSIWRARLAGWVAARECRQRECARQAEKLVEEVAAQSVGGQPLLRHPDADALLVKWTPDVAEAVRALL